MIKHPVHDHTTVKVSKQRDKHCGEIMTSELHHNISHQGCSRTSRKTTLKSVKIDKKRCFNLKALSVTVFFFFFRFFKHHFFVASPPFWEKQGSGGRWTYINDALKKWMPQIKTEHVLFVCNCRSYTRFSYSPEKSRHQWKTSAAFPPNIPGDKIRPKCWPEFPKILTLCLLVSSVIHPVPLKSALLCFDEGWPGD